MVKVVRHGKTVIGVIKVVHLSLWISWKLLALMRLTLFLKGSMTINGVQKWFYLIRRILRFIYVSEVVELSW